MRKVGQAAIPELLLESPTEASLRAMAGNLGQQQQGPQAQPSEASQQEQGHEGNQGSGAIMGISHGSWVSASPPQLARDVPKE
jgi:hypothetical protein